MERDYKAIFNGLSKQGQLALKATATFDSITDFIRDDTKLHPWRFPLYALFLGAAIIPVPAFGIPAALAGTALLCAKYKVGGTGKRLNAYLADAFHDAVLAERYKDFIVPEDDNAMAHVIRPWALAKHSAWHGLQNSLTAGKYAVDALKNHIF